MLYSYAVMSVACLCTPFLCVYFFKLGLNFSKNTEIIKNPLKKIAKERKEKKEQKKNAIYEQNIMNYDGTAKGQKKL